MNQFGRKESPECTVCRILRTDDMIPSFRGYTIYNGSNSISHESLEPSRRTNQPSKDECTISPSKNVIILLLLFFYQKNNWNCITNEYHQCKGTKQGWVWPIYRHSSSTVEQQVSGTGGQLFPIWTSLASDLVVDQCTWWLQLLLHSNLQGSRWEAS